MKQVPSFSIYDASAGSGKTYTLVKEYLRIVLSAKKDDAYRNILAITFTNKAVHEMKSRIVGGLSDFAKSDPSEKSARLMEVLSEETGLTVTEIHLKAKSIIKHLVHNYAAFDITTIDKFTHRVIRAFVHDLALPVSFEVSLDTEGLLTEAVDALIARAGDDEALTKMLIDFTMEKTDDDKSWDISREILETGRLALNENHRGEIAQLSGKTIPEFRAIRARISDSVAAIEAETVLLANRALELIRANGLDTMSFYSGYVPKHFERLAGGMIMKHEGHYKYLEPEFGKRYPAKAPDLHKTAIDEIADDLLDLLIAINAMAGNHAFYKAFLKNLTPLSLLNTVGNELGRIQAEQNILPISEFNAIIHREIQGQPAPFIYERLGEKYRHFFIDEFQDTSEMQWQNLIPLINNSLSGQDDSGQKGTLMIVGDPKQSIYRWRGGKAEQFIALSKDHNPFTNPEKELFPLETNWRSYCEVIGFNNDFFGWISGSFDHTDYSDLYRNHSFQQKTAKAGGYVNISFIPKAASDEEDAPSKTDLYLQATLNTILDITRHGFELRDIVILTRKRSQGIAVATHLTAHQIPIISSETLVIANATEVRFIIDMLRCLSNPEDLSARARMLYFIAKNISDDSQVHDLIAHGMQLNEAALNMWLSKLTRVEFSFGSLRKKSLYESVALIIAGFLRNGDNAYVQYFLDIVLERDIRGQGGISDFLDFWDKSGDKFSIPSPEGSNAIRIMTIHKSKGLEFPVVIIPFAEEDYSRKPKDKLWIEADGQDIGMPKALIDNSSAIEGFGASASAAYSQKKQEELLDNVNVLYVAMTRAEEQLHIISGMNITAKGEVKSNDMSSFFINFLIGKGIFDGNKNDYSFGDACRISKRGIAAEQGVFITSVSEKLLPSEIRIARRESLMWGTKQQEAIEYGNIIHEILAGVKTKEDIIGSVQKAVETGLITEADKSDVTNTVKAIVQNHELKEYFSPDNKILNEQEILLAGSGIVKPDRIVITNKGDVLLLDYKTGAHQQKYERQLARYAEALAGMDLNVAKTALVYTSEKVNVIHL